jgi:polysaccharide export outer membrane protein
MKKFDRIPTSCLRFTPRKMRALPVVFVVLMLIGCATERVDLPVGGEVQMERTTFSFSRQAHPFDLFPEYRIAPGDVLDVLFIIRSWMEKEEFTLSIDHTVKVQFVHAPELDTTQRVLPNGTIILPYIGELYVIGKTVDALTKDLRTRYGGILQIPEITVSVPEFRSLLKELKADLHTAPRGLSRLTTVRPDGYATFPGLQDMFVAGRTIPEVSALLNEGYKERLPGLHCDLFLEKHAGSLVYVVGQVKKPGAYSILRPLTVLEALALAESYLPGARLDSVIVIRKHDKQMTATRVDLRDSLTFAEGKELFYLLPDDIVYVPRTWISTAAEVARDISSILFFRGWGFSFTNDVKVID